MTTLGNLENGWKAKGTNAVFPNSIRSTYNLLIIRNCGFCCFIYAKKPERQVNSKQIFSFLSLIFLAALLRIVVGWALNRLVAYVEASYLTKEACLYSSL